MDLNTYQQLACRTSKWQIGDADFQGREHKLYCAIKIGEEAGECAEPIVKAAFNGHAERPESVKEELGDLLWFVQEQARAHGFTLQEVAEHNIAKLSRRYKGETYSDTASIARVDTLAKGAPTSSMRAVATVGKGTVSTAPEAIVEGE